MNLGLEGRVCVVVGGTHGIGAAAVRMLAQEGARVLTVAPGRDADERILAACPEPPWALVTDAGGSGAPDDPGEADWDELWELHVMAPMRVMRAIAPAMAGAGGGRIVNVSVAHAVMEAAQLSLSRVFADAFGSQGVLVNAVAPDAVEGERDEVAAVIAFLCSERASDVLGATWAVSS